jgi:aminopeptidase C
MKRNTFIILFAAFLLVACGHKSNKSVPAKNPFTTEILLKTTPVKDQGHSNLCWVFAMLATIETEHIMMGDSVNLSTAWVARHFLMEQAHQRYLTKGRDEITTRGVGSMLVRLIMTYGAVPYESYRANNNLNMDVLTRKLTTLVDNGVERKIGLKRMMDAADDMLENTIGPTPRNVYMLGAEYTPKEFAHSVCKRNEYMALTSFTHHPFWRWFTLELHDNLYKDQFYNVPIDTLMNRMETTVRHGHPVCWEGDISELGFSFIKGEAQLLNNDIDDGQDDVQDVRQRMFENFQTTDDHCMEIIGIAHDSNNRKYFICKNSWGKKNPYGGMMYMSFDYMKLKTIAVFLPVK